MDMMWQQMNSLPWGLGGVGMQYLMVMAWALVAGGIYMLIRDLV